MSCFPCFSSKRSASRKEPPVTADAEQDEFDNTQKNTNVPVQSSNAPAQTDVGNESNGVKTFTFRELATATKNFRPDYVLGEGGFGKVYKGSLENSGQTVAIKQLDKNGLNKDFLTEVKKLCLLHHQNLVNMIGYCADGDQRLLVYEFIPLGSLDKHLLDLPSSRQPLSWHARIKIAYGAAQGLEYLHEKTNPPVIYRDLKSSNILLDEDFSAKLSDFGLSRLGQMGELMGSYGYSGPECTSSGQVSVKADVYGFGVLMLELVTGRRVIDTTKPTHEQNLVSWATPMFKDQKRYPELVDPLLDGEFNLKELNQLVAVAAMCLQEESAVRPLMTDVVMTLSFLTTGSGPTTHHHTEGSSGD